MKKLFAAIGAILLGAFNAVLTTITFYALIGNLSYIFGIDYAPALVLVCSIVAGIGLTIAEAVTHMDTKDKGYNITKFVLMGLFIAINVFAGNIRTQNAAMDAVEQSKIEAKNDPRWFALESDLVAQHGMLKNGTYKDDAAANERIANIHAEMQAITNEYTRDARALNAGSHWLINLFWVTINLAFGLCMKLYYEGNDEIEVTKPVNYPAMKFQRTMIKNNNNQAPTPAYGQSVEQGETPKRSPGFHASWREEYAETAAKPMPIKTGRIDLPHTPEPEIVERIVYVEVPVEKETKTTEVITKKETPDMRDKARRSAAVRSPRSERRAAKARELKAKGMSVKEIAKELKLSDSTIRGYLKD